MHATALYAINHSVSLTSSVSSRSQAQTITELPEELQAFCKEGLHEEISKGVLRKKLAKMRHLIVKQAVKPEYLDSLMPLIIELFHPQQVRESAF